MSAKVKMEKDGDEMTETLLSLTLRMIYLLTGGEYVIEKKSFGDHLPHSRKKGQKQLSGNLGPDQHDCSFADWRGHKNVEDFQKNMLSLIPPQIVLIFIHC
ncbi:unnamed protein product [Ranitomeya imitator]|uniref:Uncharacterized protein n=1 Tax=Ranitomeya imitator TaxID=111125 RepID=A0ABN9LLJ5_9NEOB|nr:unnamed protein product [Ranitomeya imitator]